MALKINEYYLDHFDRKLEDKFWRPYFRDENGEFLKFLDNLKEVCRFLKLSIMETDLIGYPVVIDGEHVDLIVLKIGYNGKVYSYFKIDDPRANMWRRQIEGVALMAQPDNIRPLLKAFKEEVA